MRPKIFLSIALVAATTSGCLVLPDTKKTVVWGKRIEKSDIASIERTLGSFARQLRSPLSFASFVSFAGMSSAPFPLAFSP
jgi:hypothetical protein